MLKLMQPTPYLPQGHHLMKFEYTESDHWTPNEVSIFHKAIFKFNKDFAFISKEVKITFLTKILMLVKIINAIIIFIVGYKNSETMYTVLLSMEKSLSGRLQTVSIPKTKM